jgi:hypothetical protein
MNDEYRRGYLDALHYAAGVTLAFERMARNPDEAIACAELRQEIDSFIREFKAGRNNEEESTPDLRRAQLLSLAPRLLDSLKQLLAAIEAGTELNPGLLSEFWFVVQEAEGSDR